MFNEPNISVGVFPAQEGSSLTMICPASSSRDATSSVIALRDWSYRSHCSFFSFTRCSIYTTSNPSDSALDSNLRISFFTLPIFVFTAISAAASFTMFASCDPYGPKRAG